MLAGAQPVGAATTVLARRDRAVQQPLDPVDRAENAIADREARSLVLGRLPDDAGELALGQTGTACDLRDRELVGADPDRELDQPAKLSSADSVRGRHIATLGRPDRVAGRPWRQRGSLALAWRRAMRPPMPVEPMLARTGALPLAGGDEAWAYELKLDGFRGLLRGGSHFTVRSRRGWDMTRLVPELELDQPVVLDGELVCFETGVPHFPLVCDRLLHGDHSIGLSYVCFDLLWCDGEDLTGKPWQERRTLLEKLELDNPHLSVNETFDDGAALFAAVCDRGLEGIVAKKRAGRYQPGERRGGWVKIKNRAYWRRPQELALVEQKISAARRRAARV